MLGCLLLQGRVWIWILTLKAFLVLYCSMNITQFCTIPDSQFIWNSCNIATALLLSKGWFFFLWLWFSPSIPFVGKLRQKSFCQCRGKYLWGTEQIQLFFIWKYTRQLPKQFTFLSIFIFSIGSGHVRVRGDPEIHSIRNFWTLYKNLEFYKQCLFL